MALVSEDTSQWIDYLLNRLTQEWEALPQTEREIDTWDLIDQIDYIEEWGATESLAPQLQALMATAAPTNEQRARYRKLQQLMETNRPILERLRAS